MQRKRNAVHIVQELFQNCLFPEIVKIKIYKLKLQFYLLLFMFVEPGLLHLRVRTGPWVL